MEYDENFDKSSKILELKDICMRYHTLKGETTAIKDLNFDVYNCEFLTILGPSGCGKSTVLSIISGLLLPTHGEIRLNLKQSKTIQQTVGYMLQRDYLFDWRTIEENVILGLEIKNILNKESHEYALNLLDKYGLGDFLNHYPRQLSGGMRQKVALIRTLAVKPQILLLDEPFSALDYETRITLSQEVLDIIKNEQKTAILVSHDISEAISLSDRVIVFSKRPSRVKRTIDIDFEPSGLTLYEKRNHKKFNKYFDIIWGELSG